MLNKKQHGTGVEGRKERQGSGSGRVRCTRGGGARAGYFTFEIGDLKMGKTAVSGCRLYKNYDNYDNYSFRIYGIDRTGCTKVTIIPLISHRDQRQRVEGRGSRFWAALMSCSHCQYCPSLSSDGLIVNNFLPSVTCRFAGFLVESPPHGFCRRHGPREVDPHFPHLWQTTRLKGRKSRGFPGKKRGKGTECFFRLRP